MNSRSRRPLVGALVAFASVIFPVQQHLYGQSASGRIAGTVRDASGAAMSGVSLRITNLQDSTAQATTTDEAGRYEIRGLAPGSYAVVAAKTGFSFSRVMTHTLSAGEQFSADFKEGSADSASTPSIEQRMEAMEKQIEQLQAELEKRNSGQTADLNLRQPHGPLLATASPTPSLPNLATPPTVALNKSGAPDAPATPAAGQASSTPTATTVPPPTVDNVTPFAYADFTWLNGTPRNKDVVLGLEVLYAGSPVRHALHAGLQ